MENKVHFNLSIKSDLKLVKPTVAGILSRLGDAVRDRGLLFDLRLCLEEALINAIKHGNRQKEDLPVRIEVYKAEDRLEFKVSDKGKGFDAGRISDPTHSDNLNRLSGRGVFLIKKIMDEVRFFDGGRTIFMLKYLR